MAQGSSSFTFGSSSSSDSTNWAVAAKSSYSLKEHSFFLKSWL